MSKKNRPEHVLYPKHHKPWDLEPHYSRHVGGMTEGQLHDKADIAEQLAWRDKLIEELEASWVKATAEADAWRFWAAQKHGAPLTSDDVAREHIDGSMRFVNQARAHLQSEGVRLHERLDAVSRIVRRALACGQLEKLEDARRYLSEEPPARPEERTRACLACFGNGCIDCE